MSSSDAEIPALHSEDTVFPVYVEFYNSTQRNVDVIWVDFTGRWVRLETLEPYESYMLYTYVGHPWVFVDNVTGAQMDIAGRGAIFRAQPADVRNQSDPEGIMHIVPSVVYISEPMLTLKRRCLETIRINIQDSNDVVQLGLPDNLTREVKDIYEIFDGLHIIDGRVDESETEQTESSSEEEGGGDNSLNLDLDYHYMQTQAMNLLEAIMLGNLLLAQQIALSPLLTDSTTVTTATTETEETVTTNEETNEVTSEELTSEELTSEEYQDGTPHPDSPRNEPSNEDQ